MTTLNSTNLHAIFATDRSKEEDGSWVDINQFQGLKIKIRRLRSDAAAKEFETKLAARYGEGKLREMQKNSTGGDTNEGAEILKLQLSCVLVDWKGLVDTSAEADEDGILPEIPYSAELATELLELRDFREFVFQAANERDAFRETSNKDAVKN